MQGLGIADSRYMRTRGAARAVQHPETPAPAVSPQLTVGATHLVLGFRMVELVLFNVFLTLTTLSDTRPPHAGSAAVAFNTRPMTRDVRYKGTHHQTHYTTLPHGGFSSTVVLAFLGIIAPI